MFEYSIFGNMMQEYSVARIRKMYAEREARLAKLQTRADAENYCREVREKIAGIFNMPPRPALPPVKKTGEFDFPECHVEKLIYESRPGLPVTAFLYLPPKLTAPAPAVLFVCGHTQEGKAHPFYLNCGRTLAKQGFVVLAVDPIGQGERLQFLGDVKANGISGFCTREHLMLGKQMSLCGEFFGTWRAHDALSGLDYLLSRPEVDPSRVGITGNSGGGTMTTFVQALDPRFTMAAPSCYVTSWKRNIENELPADAEQIPPGIHVAGCEMGDFILAYAPRPILLLGQKKDFFDPRGLKETYEQCRKVYALLGAEENLRCFIGPHPHGYTEPNRMQMYNFFGEIAGVSGVDAEPEMVPFNPAAMNCAPGGQVSNMPEYKLVNDLIAAQSRQLAEQRQELSLPELQQQIKKLLGVEPDAVPVPYSRSLRCDMVNEVHATERLYNRFALETAPGILTTLKVVMQSDPYWFPETDTMTLYVPHLNSAAELADCQLDGEIAGVDVRGLGESMPLTCDCKEAYFFAPYGRDYHYNSCAVMAGSSLLAERITDLLGAISYVRSQGVKTVKLAGRGQGSVIALLTALIAGGIDSLTLYDTPESFSNMAETRLTMWPHSMMPMGILKITDLPDIRRAVAEKMPLKVVNFMDNYLRWEQ